MSEEKQTILSENLPPNVVTPISEVKVGSTYERRTPDPVKLSDDQKKAWGLDSLLSEPDPTSSDPTSSDPFDPLASTYADDIEEEVPYRYPTAKELRDKPILALGATAVEWEVASDYDMIRGFVNMGIATLSGGAHCDIVTETFKYGKPKEIQRNPYVTLATNSLCALGFNFSRKSGVFQPSQSTDIFICALSCYLASRSNPNKEEEEYENGEEKSSLVFGGNDVEA